MPNDYRIAIVDRSEGLEYREGDSVWWFNIASSWNTWTIFVPGSRQDAPERRDASQYELKRIVPRIERFLETATWRSLFGDRAVVTVLDKPHWDFDEMVTELKRRGQSVVRNPDGTTTVTPKGRRRGA